MFALWFGRLIRFIQKTYMHTGNTLVADITYMTFYDRDKWCIFYSDKTLELKLSLDFCFLQQNNDFSINNSILEKTLIIKKENLTDMLKWSL